MSKKYLVLLFVLSVFIFSCQKEADFNMETGGSTGGGTTSSGLLTKIVMKSGTDSSVQNFLYTSTGKLTRFFSISREAGIPGFEDHRFVRNSQGIVDKSIYKNSDIASAGVDSIVMNVHYDAAKSRYKSWALQYDASGTIIRDSSEFQYDATGKIIGQAIYEDDGSGTYVLTNRLDYTYSGINVVSAKLSSVSGSTTSEDFTLNYQFDTKSAPLILGNECFLLFNNLFAYYYSGNNIVKITATYPSDPPEITSLSYTYNLLNKPITQTSVSASSSRTTLATYYYQ